MPTAHIIAGADASGKTTLVSSLYQGGYFNSERFIGIELIISKELRNTRDILDVLADEDGDNEPFTKANYQKAFSIATDRRAELIHNKKDFVMETVFFTETDIGLIESLKAVGYSVFIYYVGVQKDITSAHYLLDRVIKGGHDTAVRQLVHQRSESFGMIRGLIEKADIAVMIDNSSPANPPIILNIYEQGVETYSSPGNKPSSRHITWNLSFDNRLWRSDEDKPDDEELVEAATETSDQIKTKLERIFNYLFLHTTKLYSSDWMESFIEEQLNRDVVRAILTYSSNTGIFYGNCNRPGYLIVDSRAAWAGLNGRDDCFGTSAIADCSITGRTLTVNTLNSVYVFEIIKGDLDFSKIVLAPAEIIEEYKLRNEAKFSTYWCQVSGNTFVNNAIDRVSMPYPMSRLEAVEYVSVVPTMSFTGEMVKNILAAYDPEK